MLSDISNTLHPRTAGAAFSAGGPDGETLGTGELAGNVDQSRHVRAGARNDAVDVSIIIPARNEDRWLEATLQAAFAAVDLASSRQISTEVIVVDNNSLDTTWLSLQRFADQDRLRAVWFGEPGAARARNCGGRHARGRILVFVDADTHLPVDALVRIKDWCDQKGKEAGITRLASLEGGWKAFLWWSFWEQVRRLPLSHAKAMPALMFCTAKVFEEFGPFDEEVAIGEEWPILASLYRQRRHRFIYDRSLTGLTSSRRMERQSFGYSRTFLKYVWAILHKPGRINYTDRIR